MKYVVKYVSQEKTRTFTNQNNSQVSLTFKTVVLDDGENEIAVDVRNTVPGYAQLAPSIVVHAFCTCKVSSVATDGGYNFFNHFTMHWLRLMEI